MDAPDWVNNLYRRAHADQINAAVEAFARKYTMEEFTNLLQGKGIPCVPVNTPLGFANDEHVQGRGFMVAVDHAGFGPAKQSAMPFVIDGARIPVGSVPVLDSWRSPYDISPVAGERREGADRLSPGWDSGKKPTPVTKSVSAANRDNGPLDGMRIVSFDHVLAGPYGTTILAELGADVIKVESRRGGLDPFRFFGTGEDVNLSPRFLEFNRNKRSVTIDLKHPRGPELIKELVRRCDAIMDNFSLRVMPSIGLCYEHLVKIKEDIICLRMPGLGGTGPKSHYATVGPNIN